MREWPARPQAHQQPLCDPGGIAQPTQHRPFPHTAALHGFDQNAISAAIRSSRLPEQHSCREETFCPGSRLNPARGWEAGLTGPGQARGMPRGLPRKPSSPLL